MSESKSKPGAGNLPAGMKTQIQGTSPFVEPKTVPTGPEPGQPTQPSPMRTVITEPAFSANPEPQPMLEPFGGPGKAPSQPVPAAPTFGAVAQPQATPGGPDLGKTAIVQQSPFAALGQPRLESQNGPGAPPQATPSAPQPHFSGAASQSNPAGPQHQHSKAHAQYIGPASARPQGPQATYGVPRPAPSRPAPPASSALHPQPAIQSNQVQLPPSSQALPASPERTLASANASDQSVSASSLPTAPLSVQPGPGNSTAAAARGTASSGIPRQTAPDSEAPSMNAIPASLRAQAPGGDNQNQTVAHDSAVSPEDFMREFKRRSESSSSPGTLAASQDSPPRSATPASGSALLREKQVPEPGGGAWGLMTMEPGAGSSAKKSKASRSEGVPMRTAILGIVAVFAVLGVAGTVLLGEDAPPQKGADTPATLKKFAALEAKEAQASAGSGAASPKVPGRTQPNAKGAPTTADGAKVKDDSVTQKAPANADSNNPQAAKTSAAFSQGKAGSKKDKAEKAVGPAGMAASQYLRGEYAAARKLYSALATEHPNAPAYAAMVRILDKKLQAKAGTR